MVPLEAYLILAAILFGIGLTGVMLCRRNSIVLLMSIELILLSANTNFIAFSHFLHQQLGQVFVFFILTVAAAETATGLAILVIFYRLTATIAIDRLSALKG